MVNEKDPASCVENVIKKRRSTRFFSDEPVTVEQIEKIIDAALYSPSALGIQPWEIIIVQDKEMLAQLARCVQWGLWLLKANVGFVFIIDANKSDFWKEDVSCALENMWIMAEAMGLGASFAIVTGTDNESKREERIRKLLNIPGRYKIWGIMGVGHKDPEIMYLPKELRPRELAIHWDHYCIERGKIPRGQKKPCDK